MQPIQEGQRVPEVSLLVRKDGAFTQVTTKDLFSGKKVVLFGLPGAFTPTCSSSHVPRYEELAPELAAFGVDKIYCVSVNDAFVMEAWAHDQGVERVELLPDGNGTLTEALGLLVDKGQIGFGKRSWRYSMLVDDGVVTKAFIEEEKPGDPYDVSDADTMLAHLGGGKVRSALDIVMVSKPGCGHCARARSMLHEAKLPFEEIKSTPRILRALSAHGTTPQVFVDGQLVGGADELGAWLTKRA